MADWDRLEESSRDFLTLALLQCLGVGNEAENLYQLSMTAWSLVMLKRHLPPPAATSAFSAFIHHCTSSDAVLRSSWRDWGQLLHALGAAGMQCSNCYALTRLCDKAVKLLSFRMMLDRSLSYKDISMPFSAMVTVGYRGNAQPLLQAVTAAIFKGCLKDTARFDNWRELILAARELPGCSFESQSLVLHFSCMASSSWDSLDAEDVSTILRHISSAMQLNLGYVEKLAELAAGPLISKMGSSQLATSLDHLAYIGYLDSSVRSLAVKVAEADLTAYEPQELTKLLDARSMFLSLSIQQAVSSGHSQLASEPELNSMAAALWRECGRREAVGQQWSEEELLQLHTARQIKDACTGGQTSLAASPPLPSLQKFVAQEIICRNLSA
ncbi:hypothetical protein V8C86DRAFT_968036 [Haematococcus lacustris]